MAYEFSTKAAGHVTISDEWSNTFKIMGVNARSNDADSLMEALNSLLDIVGWNVEDVVRSLDQEVIEVEEGT